MERTKDTDKNELKTASIRSCGKVIIPNPKPNADMAKKKNLASKPTSASTAPS